MNKNNVCHRQPFVCQVCLIFNQTKKSYIMKRTILLSLIVITATLLQAQKQVLKSVNSLQKMPNKNIIASNNLKNLVASSIETFDDSVLTTTNGIPLNWSYTPNSSNIDDQFKWYNNGSNGCFGKLYNDTNTVYETINTDTYTVPASSAYLSFDFMCSYYWMIENGTDSVEIYYSIDAGSTWNSIWSNRNPILVEASGIGFPYASGEWLTPMIKLPSSTYNQNITFRIVYAGGTGNYFLIDNLCLKQSHFNDLAFFEIYPDFGEVYLDGWYSNIPIDQVQPFKRSKLFVKNIGELTQTGINVDMGISYNGSNVYSANVNLFSSGVDSIDEFNTFDTMMINSDYLAYQIGTYDVKYTVNQDQTDEDLSDNDTIYTFNVTNNVYSRYNTINISASPSQYAGGSDGDFMGCVFKINTPTVLDHISCYIADGTTDNSGLTAEIYKYDNSTSSYISVGYSDDYYASVSDIGTTVNFQPINTLNLDSGIYSIGFSFHWTAGVSNIFIGAETGFDQNISAATSLNIGGTWYYIYNVPAIDVYLEPTPNTQITASATYGASSSFADSCVNISLYKDNGATADLVQVPKTMVNEMVNFEYLLDGDYYLKSQVIDTLAYSTVLPIYFYDASIIDSATAISVSSGDSIAATINHPETSLIPGTNTIQGTLNTVAKSSEDLSGEVAVLQDATTNEVLFVSVTDENGHYWFGNVTDDLNVKVYFTSFNYPNWSAASFSTENDSSYVVNFIINGDSIYPDGFVNISNVSVEKIDFSLYPNPAKDILHLENIPTNSTVKIFSQTGKLIISDIRKEKTSIDVSNLAKGNYIIVVTNNEGSIGTQKFVKE